MLFSIATSTVVDNHPIICFGLFHRMPDAACLFSNYGLPIYWNHSDIQRLNDDSDPNWSNLGLLIIPAVWRTFISTTIVLATRDMSAAIVSTVLISILTFLPPGSCWYTAFYILVDCSRCCSTPCLVWTWKLLCGMLLSRYFVRCKGGNTLRLKRH